MEMLRSDERADQSPLPRDRREAPAQAAQAARDRREARKAPVAWRPEMSPLPLDDGRASLVHREWPSPSRLRNREPFNLKGHAKERRPGTVGPLYHLDPRQVQSLEPSPARGRRIDRIDLDLEERFDEYSVHRPRTRKAGRPDQG